MSFNQQLIPSISTFKNFDRFIKSNYQVCFLMNFHVSRIKELIDSAHTNNKQVIVHIDLINGLSSDEYGCEYLCQSLKADGVISTKIKILEVAKKNNKISILRLFLIDTQSLEKGLSLANNLQPNYLEILPAIAFDIIPYIINKCSIDIIGGGLIKEQSQIYKAISYGIKAVSISDEKLW